MKKNVVTTGKIYFLNFTFNPKSRTLQQYDTVLQLRKKQSDVLALLCAKYPEPVSQAEFLAEVWGGGYVTSQSIAQMICSLRVSLGDDTKSIIVTIPKLGYQLTAEPCREEPETEPDKPSCESSFLENIGVDNVSFSTQSMINTIPGSANSMPIITYSAPRTVPDRRELAPQILFLGSVAAFFRLCRISIGKLTEVVLFIF
ncbi:winged helix-turn-helix domain-containing protein [Yersinia aldovae]|uniref:winged helix-turn-helix domain-containing protein n=1 Tax=Yersinia aldovae TaxID=29483 RepID=UPI00119F1EC6|nr:winged helix-turn-helix domain-containing protein [Yersinia aldovae]